MVFIDAIILIIKCISHFDVFYRMSTSSTRVIIATLGLAAVPPLMRERTACLMPV